MFNIHKLFRLMVLIALCLSLGACASLIGGPPRVLSTFHEPLLDQGKGAVMMHAINQGSLIATRWFKMDDPDQKYSFTVYRSDRHRSLDRMDLYDVVMVDPGTYVLYSIFSNCEEGMRPSSTDWDEPMRKGTANYLGMTSWLRSWKPGAGLSTGVGLWGGSGSQVGMGMGIDMGLSGMTSGPGLPTAICNLVSTGFVSGRPALATVTVKAGEVVYAGELHLDYRSNRICENMGNWLTDNETREYCGVDWVRLRVGNSYDSLARPFIEKYLGAKALERSVVRLAQPGSQVSVR